MEARHREITEIALASAGRYGFALAGGYAVQAHGMGNRLSSDVDLFTDSRERTDFTRAVDEVIAAFEASDYDVASAIRNDVFARLLLTKRGSTEPDKLEMAVDWRAHAPVDSLVGPVLHPDDAVANKMCALFSRAESRDFLDVEAAISSGRYSRETLIELARQADPGSTWASSPPPCARSNGSPTPTSRSTRSARNTWLRYARTSQTGRAH
ncbi:nucleotidyl transferase AbiEii/AbiGii toxin family protein [Catellatospora sichuanensis]|uniref:nucleotidyl transferase AbiEii/AbiGii toxin family protein n=1 Tax=Catellatospora sichuanensis TaxID=1969805 RepID=UPI001FEAC74D|nr:nucleotidyl transferase AbiEii/AbiGii toxin family protein [Catellatospora sichuanensis]